VACASLRYRSARLNVVGVEPKGSKCNLKNLKCVDVSRRSERAMGETLVYVECPWTPNVSRMLLLNREDLICFGIISSSA